MTLVRDILLTVLAFAPLTAWGQVFTESQPGIIEGGGTAQMTRGRNGSIIDPRFAGDSAPGLISDPSAATMPDPMFDTAFQNQSGNLPPHQLPQAIMPGVARHFSSPIWQTTAKGGYFGIMGAVAQPGVYFHKNERINLGELLKIAGGATPMASGGVRIVRQGRGGLQTFLTPDSPHEIMNGDVVLLESHGAHGRAGLREYPKVASKGGAADQQAPAANPTTYLAFVNLMPQPIIVPVPSEQATMVSVMKWLRQDTQSPHFVRVLSPTPVLRQNPGRMPEQELLENGTVVVFDPGTVRRERLPAFPPVMRPAVASDADAIPIAPDVTPMPSPAGIDPARIPAATPRGQQLSPDRRQAGLKPARVPATPLPQRDLRPSAGQHIGQTQQPLAPTDAINDVAAPVGPATGGPLLMMPQMNQPARTHATGRESQSRDALPPQRVEGSRNDAATPANYVGERMSWQSRPPVRANVGMPEVDDRGVIQAHGEHGQIDDEFGGPALELPKPVPQLLHADATVTSHPVTAAASAVPITSTFSARIIWFSLGSMLLLVAALWCMSRWDGPRPVRAAISAGHTSRFRVNTAPANASSAPQVGLHFVKRTEKTLAEAPTPITPVAPAVPAPPVRATPPAPTAAPGPTRVISQEEQKLVAAFREARHTRVPAISMPAIAPSPIEQPAPTTPVAPIQTISERQTRFAEHIAASTARIQAQAPHRTQPTQSRATAIASGEANRSTSPANSSGNLLDRILRAQQKR